jgi:eukaryotic-like serine/threonine-protein kinase
VFERACEAEPDPVRARRTLVSRLLDNEALACVLREVGRPPVKDEDRLVTARFAGPLETLLSALGPEHFDAVLATAAHVEVEEVRPPLMKYLAHHARGNEEKLGALLTDAHLGRARAILAILARMDTDGARRALRKAEHNASAELRVEAVAVRAARSTGDLKDELTALSADADPAIRMAALRTMARHKLKEAGPALSQRVQSPAFHKLSAEERRLALETLHSLSPLRAETVALEIASRQSVITRSSHDETRLVAIELLGRVSSEPKLATELEQLAKKWTNAELVRAAATEAARETRARSAPGTVVT